MAVYPGYAKVVHIAAEAVWGTKDESPAYLHLPVLSETMKSTRIQVMSDHFVGQRQKLHTESVGYNVGGNITTDLFGWQDGSNNSLAEHLIGWAVNNPTSHTLESKTIEVFDSDVDNKRFLGNRVNTMTISGSAGQPVTISLDTIGQSEAGGITEQTWTPATALAILRTKMFFKDATFEIPNATAVAIADFSLVLQNQLQPDFLNSATLTHLTAGERLWSLSFTIRKTANTYDALRRAQGEGGTSCQINLQGSHNSTGATGTKTTLVIDIDRMNFQDATITDQDRNALVSVGPQYMPLSPADGGNDIEFTFGEAA